MWDEVGILRTADGLRRGLAGLAELRAGLHRTGLADGDRAFNMTWQDWINLESQLAVSEVIAVAALAREDSRGAHFPEEFPETGPQIGRAHVLNQDTNAQNVRRLLLEY